MKKKSLGQILWENSLLIAMLGAFVLFLFGLSVAGFYEYNEEQQSHKEPRITYTKYLTTADFQEAVFENWESEFLQMWAFVVLTIFLRQKGSAESKKLRGKEDVDAHSKYSLLRSRSFSQATKAILHGLYSHSLSLSLLILFLFSFVMHAISGAHVYNEEAIVHGDKTVGIWEYIQTSRFWFESFQNWQSEFLAVGALILLSIYLRERGSPESKPVAESDEKTGK